MLLQPLLLDLEFNEDSDLDNSDTEEPSTEDIQKAYQIMYEN